MESKRIVLEMNDSELALILSALRSFEQQYDGRDRIAINNDWPDHFEGLDPIAEDGIEDLCERINCAPDAAIPVIIVEGGIVQEVFAPTPNATGEPFIELGYDLVDFDIFDGSDDADIARHWEALDATTQTYFKTHRIDEYARFKAVLDRIARGKRAGPG